LAPLLFFIEMPQDARTKPGIKQDKMRKRDFMMMVNDCL
jgi:hypothetical protein